MPTSTGDGFNNPIAKTPVLPCVARDIPVLLEDGKIYPFYLDLEGNVRMGGVGEIASVSGQVSGAGNNALVTPAAGKKLRVYYVSYNPLVAAECAFRLGGAGALWLRNSVVAFSVIAKDFGDFRYIEGAVDAPLYLYLSVGVATNWNANYVEV